jgi:phosphoglycolate phosphatase-like HAD superfamily hydrolase
MRLVLFDIDGTLIHVNRGGRAALAAALTELFGTAGPIESYSMAGKTDSRIVRDLLGAAGFSPAQIEARLESVYEEMAWRAPAIFRRHNMLPCPGVPALLSALQQRSDVLLGLLTGNNRITAPLKLQAAGIDPALFTLGAFGCDQADRNRLPEIAMERARALIGEPISPRDTVIVGDTPADIICGRSSGAVTVAVASGGYSSETLASYHPDVLLTSLLDTPAVVAIVTQDAAVEANI